MPWIPTSRQAASPSSLILFSTSFCAFSTISSILAGWIRPSTIRRSSAILATSLRIGSNPDKTTASGVSSMISSTPVKVSRVRILRPSRPMMRPFISSFGSCTTDTVVSATWSAAHRWMAVTTKSLAFLSASSFALFSSSLISFAVSCFTSSSTDFKRYSFACSEVRPEIRSSSCIPCSYWASTSAVRSPRMFSLLTRSASFFSRASAFFSTFSSLLNTRFS